MSSDAEVSVHVDAPADAVYRLVSDLTRMGEFSPECTRVVWRRGATGPAVGAKFRGYNKKGVIRWFTDGKVVAAEPGRAFAFDVTSFGLGVARWGYRIEPDADGSGCTITETWDDHRTTPGFKTVTGLVLGVRDRGAHNTAGMEATLQQIKAAAEAERVGSSGG
jgi:hypothetical protein